MSLPRINRSFLVVAGALAVAGAAQAVELSFEQGGLFGRGGFEINIDGTDIGPTTAGRYSFTVGEGGSPYWNAGQSITTFCMELSQHVSQNAHDYSMYGGQESLGLDSMPNADHPGGATLSSEQAGLLSDLFANFFRQSKKGSRDEAAAFQLAVWEIVYESGGDSEGSLADSLDVSSGGFQVTGGEVQATALGLANSWLATIEDNGIRDSMLGLQNDTFQDQITMVPLPGALLMGLAGLGGVAVARKRLR